MTFELNMVADENVKSRGLEIEKKIEFLESLAGKVILTSFLILVIFFYMLEWAGNLCILW